MYFDLNVEILKVSFQKLDCRGKGGGVEDFILEHSGASFRCISNCVACLGVTWHWQDENQKFSATTPHVSRLYLYNVFATLLYLKVGGDTKGYEGLPSTGNKGLTSLTISLILQMYLPCLSSSVVVDFLQISIILHPHKEVSRKPRNQGLTRKSIFLIIWWGW